IVLALVTSLAGLREIADRAGRRLTEGLDPAPFLGTPLEGLVETLSPLGIGFAPRELRTELLRFHWQRVARMQVWTAAGLLFVMSVLALVYRRLGLDTQTPLPLLILAPAGL